MSNLTGRAPFQKGEPVGERPDYLDAVRSLPCCICEAFGEQQLSKTTAHHPIHGRYSRRKVPDIMAIPLCDGHHQSDFDKSKTAIHRGKKTWAAKYGMDTDYIATTQDKLANLITVKGER